MPDAVTAQQQHQLGANQVDLGLIWQY